MFFLNALRSDAKDGFFVNEEPPVVVVAKDDCAE